MERHEGVRASRTEQRNLPRPRRPATPSRVGRRPCGSCPDADAAAAASRAILWLPASASGLAWNTVSGRGIALAPERLRARRRRRGQAPRTRGPSSTTAPSSSTRGRSPSTRWSHIPGALPLPEDDFDTRFAKLEPRLRVAFDIVVYCSGFGCEASHLVARKLQGARDPGRRAQRRLAGLDGRRLSHQAGHAALRWLRHPGLYWVVSPSAWAPSSSMRAWTRSAHPLDFARIV